MKAVVLVLIGLFVGCSPMRLIDLPAKRHAKIASKSIFKDPQHFYYMQRYYGCLVQSNKQPLVQIDTCNLLAIQATIEWQLLVMRDYDIHHRLGGHYNDFEPNYKPGAAKLWAALNDFEYSKAQIDILRTQVQRRTH